MSGIDEQGNVVGSGDMAAQTSYTLRKIKECVEQAGGTTDNLMDFLGYTTDQRNQIYQLTALDDFVVKDPRSGPKRSEHLACTTITMPGLWHPDILGQMHIYGVLGNKTQVNLGEWVTWHDFYPVDMAPYAVKVGRYVFVSGAVMFDQLFNEPTLEEDFPSIRKQARWAFQEYQRFLKTIGANMDNVVFIQPYAPVQFQEPIMEVAREFFHNEQPVWNPVGHRGLFLPNHLCEIYGMAIVDETLP
jgi:enamine deaminase RidA (YjgF/YER057c/UK114 family)